MPNYQQGKIYTIRCYDDPTLVYVGSTTQTLSQRWGGHKRDSLKNQDRLLYSRINNEWEKWYIELYELYLCNSKMELEKREGEIIREIGTLNKIIARRTKQEYHQDNKDNMLEKQNKYFQENRDNLLERKKQYYQENRDNLLEKQNKYYQENRDNLLEKYKQYYQENRDNLLEKKKQYHQDNRDNLLEKKKQYYIKKKQEQQP